MAEEKETKAKIKKPKSDVVGHLAQPIPLDKTVKLDADITQVLSDHLIMAGLSGRIDAGEIEKFTSISNTRDTQYNQLDTMCGDASVSAVIRTIAEDVCEVSDNGHIMWAESQDPKISKHINYLLNVANVDKSAYKWTYSLLKYGDVYLKLLRESDYEDQLFSGKTINKVRNARLNENIDESIYLNMKRPGDRYSYQLEMIPNPSTMFELTKHDVTCGFIETPDNKYSIGESSMFMDSAALGQAGSVSTVGAYNYRMKSNDVIIHQADAFVHACLEDNLSRYPETVDMFLPDDETRTQNTKKDLEKNGSLVSYTVKRGKSILYDAYKIWREKQLLEGAVLLSRLTRSSVYRKVGVEMGNTSREKSAQILRSVKDMFEQKSSYNAGVGMSEYTNPGAVENFIYHATRNGKGAITVETIGGDYDPKSLVDLDTWNTKFYSAFGIPKQYFGWCLSKDTEILLLDGSTHTIEELYNNKDNYIGKGILGCNKDGSLCPTKITNIMLTNPAAKCLRIWLDNGKYVDVTPDHRMMLRDGSFVPAGELKEGDSLMPYYDRIKDGRRYVLDNALGKFVPQYHIVAAAKGEPAEVGYNIHYINRIKIDDDFDNLVKLSIEDHCKEHNRDLATEHKLANEKRRLNGEAVNGNVGGRYITNGDFYTTIKAGEELPDGFWFEGPKKPDSMKKAISDLMKGKKKNYDNTSHLNTPEIQAKSLAARQKTYDLQTGRKEYLVRCPNCGKIHKVKITPEEYVNYLNMEKFYYCSADCRAKFDYNGKLEYSLALYNQESNKIDAYEAARKAMGRAGSLYFTKANLENRLSLLVDYVPEVNHKVVKIEVLEDPVAVYDLTVADECHTFALPVGIFVHNCEDGAGFNGGTALTILSSVYGKNVKRVQNALIQAITQAINLFLYESGLLSYANNFVLKMKTPLTQEEKDYRENLSNRVNAISSINSLFTDVETRSTRLTMLRDLLSTLNLGDDIVAKLGDEIKKALEEEEKAKADAEKAEEEAAKEAATGAASGDADLTADTGDGGDLSLDLDGGDTEVAATGEGEDLNLDLASLPDAPDTPTESFTNNGGSMSLTEDTEFLDEDVDLPNPDELEDIDFSKNK